MVLDDNQDRKIETEKESNKLENRTLTSILSNLPETKRIIEFREGFLSENFYYKQIQPESYKAVFNSIITQIGHQNIIVRYASQKEGVIIGYTPLFSFFDSYRINVHNYNVDGCTGTLCEVRARSPIKKKLEKILLAVVHC